MEINLLILALLLALSLLAVAILSICLLEERANKQKKIIIKSGQIKSKKSSNKSDNFKKVALLMINQRFVLSQMGFGSFDKMLNHFGFENTDSSITKMKKTG